jgi:hypothetical protein
MDAKLEQRVIMQFLWSEKTDPVEIHYSLSRTFQEDAYTISSVHEWVRTFKTGRTIVLDELRAERPRLDHIGSTTVSLLTENGFHGVRALAQEMGVSLSTVWDGLVNVLAFSLRHARRVPILLTAELQAQRITRSIEMLRILQTQEPTNFAGVVTGDESWSFLGYFRNRVWTLGDEHI